jgi:hypothetical protein
MLELFEEPLGVFAFEDGGGFDGAGHVSTVALTTPANKPRTYFWAARCRLE